MLKIKLVSPSADPKRSANPDPQADFSVIRTSLLRKRTDGQTDGRTDGLSHTMALRARLKARDLSTVQHLL